MKGQGPAYAFSAQPGIHDACLGLSKRELFAAMAMQGMCASGEYAQATGVQIATYSLECADALLAALEQQP